MPRQLSHADSEQEEDAWLPDEPAIQVAVSTFIVTLRDRGNVGIAAELAAVLQRVSV